MANKSKNQPILLPYTLQTWCGMVLNNGAPQSRRVRDIRNPPSYPPLGDTDEISIRKISDFTDYSETAWPTDISQLATTCIQQDRLPTIHHTAHRVALEVLTANINACRSPSMTQARLTGFIRRRTRLDLEQGAAAVVSAFVAAGRMAEAARLLREMRGVLAAAHCWVPGDWSGGDGGGSGDDASLPSRGGSPVGAALEGLARKTVEWCAKAGVPDLPLPTSFAELVSLLLRIRRVRPKGARRGLYVPEWMVVEAGIEAPQYLKDFWVDMEDTGEPDKGVKLGIRPTVDTQDSGETPIVFSKKMFNVMQRRLFKAFHFWDQQKALAFEVRDLESQVLFAERWIKGRLLESDDVAQIAYWFFSFLRRLQLTVVSNIHWDRFLERGEGHLLYQNNIKVQSTFETVLADIAGQSGRDTLATGDDTLDLIDRTCLLMKKYVDVYGGGRKENLVFARGTTGGSGRGNVDLYNVLCDILVELRNRAKDEGTEKLPGKVYKFLAKDIMHWNNAWQDDAFAGGKVHGWELWILERNLISNVASKRDYNDKSKEAALMEDSFVVV
jgi:hypothetical protein